MHCDLALCWHKVHVNQSSCHFRWRITYCSNSSHTSKCQGNSCSHGYGEAI